VPDGGVLQPNGFGCRLALSAGVFLSHCWFDRSRGVSEGVLLSLGRQCQRTLPRRFLCFLCVCVCHVFSKFLKIGIIL
jgi:hypothetical protein